MQRHAEIILTQDYRRNYDKDSLTKAVNITRTNPLSLNCRAGWGKKRITDFIETLNATMDEYHQHCIDGVFDYMAEQELSSAGIELDQLLPKQYRLSSS